METKSLYHHGILGMHWGQKNGPPYPLGASDHSASEKKAGYQKSINGSSTSETTSSNKPKGTINTSKSSGSKIGENKQLRNKATNTNLQKSFNKKANRSFNDRLERYVKAYFAAYALITLGTVLEYSGFIPASLILKIATRYRGVKI